MTTTKTKTMDTIKAQQYARELLRGDDDAVGGLLLASGNADECSGNGLTDAEDRCFVTYRDGEWRPTALGLAVLPHVLDALDARVEADKAAAG